MDACFEYSDENNSGMLRQWSLPDNRFRGHKSTLTHVHRIQFVLADPSAERPARVMDDLPPLGHAVLNDAAPCDTGVSEGLSGMVAKSCAFSGEGSQHIK